MITTFVIGVVACAAIGVITYLAISAGSDYLNRK
jgi:hypothetical protein